MKLAAELRETGRAAIKGAGYDRGSTAIATLFPGSDYAGDIKLFFSQIKSERGGDIRLFAPGGAVNAGLANPPGGFSKLPSELGIVTVHGGDVQALVRDDFLVNQSRVFTLQGATFCCGLRRAISTPARVRRARPRRRRR
jgi:hypothetical protein